MTIGSDLLQRHIQTLVQDNAQWQTLIADDLVWELPYAPALGHPADVSTVRTMWCSCVPRAARSPSYVNTSTPHVRRRRWTRRFLVSNPEDKRRTSRSV